MYARIIKLLQFASMICCLLFIVCSCSAQNKDVIVGAYYFGGWAGYPTIPHEWDKNAPSHATESLEKDFVQRKPLWGWRDDTDLIMEKQIDLAADNGINCFFFDWYWSDNRKNINIKAIGNNSLHDCINRFMRVDNNIKMNFALMISNHHGYEIIGKDNWISTIDYMSRNYFHHPRYLKFDGKPVIAVFRGDAMYPYLENIRKEAVKNGFPGIYIICLSYRYKGFDAYSWYSIFEPYNNEAPAKKYKQLTEYTEKQWNSLERDTVFPNVMVGWDKRPWETINNKKIIYYTNRSPKIFGKHLSNAFKFLENKSYRHKVIFIYAWNEIGEGGYLMPTVGDPRGAYLLKVKDIRTDFMHNINNFH